MKTIPSITTDGKGGAIVAYSSDDATYAKFLRKVGGSVEVGDVILVDPLIGYAEIVSDGEGGGIVFIESKVGGNFGRKIFAQFLGADGTIGIQQVIEVASAGSFVLAPAFASDGNGGAFVFDQDGFNQIYLNHLTRNREVIPYHYKLNDLFPNAGTTQKKFIRGDADNDGRVTLTDSIKILKHLFQGDPAPSCLDAADTNDNGDLSLTDAVYLLNHLFKGGPAPPAPYPQAGEDTTKDNLTC